jgi:pSer/pThr/pTyr-binding forkhead associated (FHA) protein
MSVTVLEILPSRGRELELAAGAVIGRGPECDVRLDDPLVSRRHARVVGTAIEDLGSANGLFLNSRRSEGVTPLRVGDVIQLGATVWLVQGQLMGDSERGPTA